MPGERNKKGVLIMTKNRKLATNVLGFLAKSSDPLGLGE